MNFWHSVAKLVLVPLNLIKQTNGNNIIKLILNFTPPPSQLKVSPPFYAITGGAIPCVHSDLSPYALYILSSNFPSMFSIILSEVQLIKIFSFMIGIVF